MMNMPPFTATLLRWYEQHGRSLPWRADSNPYAIWLSEIILQQTRIEQGLPYWERFMQRFPSVEALAAATEDDVLRLWQGLGYYSRARNLHAAARQVVSEGGFPQTYEGLRSLKGVGDYTAAAIGSFAFNLPVAAVDGNAYRVFARHFGIDTPINTTQGKRLFSELAQSLLPERQAADFNQAMMDFGATWCTPSSPQCASCPFVETCEALHSKRVAELPVKLRKTKIKTRHLSYIYIICKGEIAIRRRPSGDIWQGLWEVPVVETGKDDSDGEPLLQQLLASETVVLLRSGVRHVLTHRIIIADFYLLETASRPPLPDEYVWIPETAFDNYGKPRLMELLMESLPTCRSDDK